MPGRAAVRFASLVILALTCSASGVGAQAVDGAVLSRGAIRLDVGGVFAHADRRAAADGNEPVSAWYQALVSDVLSGVAVATGDEIERFFAATGGVPAGGSSPAASLGDATTSFHSTTRHVPFRLAVGILPRTELTLGISLERDELLVQTFWLSGGTLGLNPNPVNNAALLAGIDPSWEVLGASALLPTAESPLGLLLRQRVEALTGGTLALPTVAADVQYMASVMQEIPGATPPPSGLRQWRAGDLEIGVRALVLSSFGEAAYPAADDGLNYRLTAAVAARLPTGQQPEPIEPFTQLPTVGHTGIRFGTDADLFLGRRFWLASSVGLLTLRSRHEAGTDTPLVEAVVWSPASTVSLTAAPRYRLTESILIGGRYEMDRSGTSTREIRGTDDSFVLATPAGTVQRLGVELRYTTLPGIAELSRGLRGPLAVEAGIGYLQTFSAPPGLPLPRAVVLQVSLLNRLWGGGAPAGEP